jgi:hypothetical protein
LNGERQRFASLSRRRHGDATVRPAECEMNGKALAIAAFGGEPKVDEPPSRPTA